MLYIKFNANIFHLWYELLILLTKYNIKINYILEVDKII